ncbi:hypothetical protein PQD71_gp186 [Kosakonia phage Kc263]|uniref:Uncharacterized protein n=1 Tax=Kosakonia phage Kc263 TaxID=2863194 RepID=A0AAE7WG07_9CAUD|nr:hypothetical protein PQD71_gp186 [Kosakonia phage Kc263]QYN80140.1 hypothetical protein [Kosakonia phage Kc263]
MSQERYTCIGKGGTYELLGVAKPVDMIPLNARRLGNTIGAGLSKMESIKVYQLSTDELVYEKDIAVWGMSHYPRYVYMDVDSKQLFHRSKEDFTDRMEKISN